MKWDLYDNKFQKTDLVIEESDFNQIPKHLYHLTVNVWIMNSEKKVLLLKKAMNYDLRYPGSWTSINGNVESASDAITTVYKTVQDKIGINIRNDKIREIGKDLRDPYNYIYNTFVIYKEIDTTLITLNEKYYSKVKWVDKDELENMILNGEIEFSLISRIEKYILPLLKSKK